MIFLVPYRHEHQYVRGRVATDRGRRRQDCKTRGILTAHAVEAVLVTLSAGLLSVLVTWLLVRAALKLLVAYNIVDRPGKRSSHEGNVPTGGGIAVIGVVLTIWICLALMTGTLGEIRIIVAAGAVLAVISFIDDIRYVSPWARLVAHGVAVALGLTLLPDSALLFDGSLPLWADRSATGVAWVWFINLFNFMDGIDGITGVETIAVAGGLAAALLLMAPGENGDWSKAALAAVLAGAGVGFLVHNWHPAQLFLGDTGSVALGYLLGWLLVWSACVAGLWWLALVLPLYYWADATLTLLVRGARGEKVWRAHRQHAYQIAVRAGASHAAVAGFIALLNVALILLALLALLRLIPVGSTITLAVVLTAMALWRLHHWSC